ncbi:MAG: GGDEF domain-containing protein [Lachnospiraceae bacterium]|nr:GGDEF domain-containing protein [Lachnospiraceae bacterium]
MNGVLDLSGMIVHSDRECVHFISGRGDYPLSHIIHEDDKDEFQKVLDEAKNANVHCDLILRMKRIDGTYAPFCMSLESKDDDEGRRVSFSLKDLLLLMEGYENALDKEKAAGERRQEKENAKRHAYGRTGDLDPATGILNKPSIQNYCKERLSKIKEEQTIWLAIGDIDDFKNVNDTYGHAFGDQVILETARCIKNEIGPNGAVGRFGGDEFFICVENSDEPGIRKILTEFRKTLEWNVMQMKSDCHVTMSVGTVCAPLNGTDYDELFAKADKALYIAKGKGKNRYIIYREVMHGDTVIPKDETAIRYAHSYTERVSATIARMTAKFVSRKRDAIDEAMHEIMDAFVLDEISVFSGEGLGCVYTSRKDQKDSVSEEVVSDILNARRLSVNGVLVVNRLTGYDEMSPALYQWLSGKKVSSAIFCLFYDGDHKVSSVYVYKNRSSNSRKWGAEDPNYLLIFSNMVEQVMKLEDKS